MKFVIVAVSFLFLLILFAANIEKPVSDSKIEISNENFSTNKIAKRNEIARNNKTKDGFKGFGWGTDYTVIADLYDLRLVTGQNPKSNLKYYNVSDITSLGAIQLSQCVFLFYDGKFSTVMLFTEGDSNWELMILALRKVYGLMSQPNSYTETYNCNTGFTIRQYSKNSYTDKGTYVLSSEGVFNLVERDKYIKANTAVDDF